ncbi:MAG: ATP-binding protein [Eubacteriaceae bacterium]|nr:ATP-binding protein [Eubacteriaceae bacterium]
MKKNLPISTDDFPTVINGGYYFVDKSMFIAEALSNMSETKLILRPRRFGKSLNMSMLKAFLEIGSPKGLFDGLAISGQKDFCEAHQGKYPVISLSFKDVEASGFQKALDALGLIISREADKLEIGCGCPELKTSENAMFDRMSEKQADENDVKSSILLMSIALYRRYGKKAIVLIDEYDAPINQAYRMGYYDEMVGLFRGLLSQALKSNPYVEFAVMTGVLRVSKESVFSGLNNIAVYSALHTKYSAHFGFTGEEVATMLSYYGLEGRMADMKEYYDGYRIGSLEMYNPWSVVRACSDMLEDKSAEPKEFWINTASNDLVRDLLKQDGLRALESIDELANGGTVKKRVSILATYRDLIDISASEAVWDMMFMAGYLTWVRKSGRDMYELRAPNLEIRAALRNDALLWAMSSMPIDEGKAEKLYAALLAGNSEDAEAVINGLFQKVLSVRDGVVVHGSFEIKQERHYHLITTALLACSGWSVESEIESGDGYLDTLCTNEDIDAAIVIEEKFSAKSDDASLSGKAQEAMEQITNKKYAEIAEGFSTIVAVGIAYANRRCKMVIKQLG